MNFFNFPIVHFSVAKGMNNTILEESFDCVNNVCTYFLKVKESHLIKGQFRALKQNISGYFGPLRLCHYYMVTWGERHCE